jgi:hypothetical protein
LFRARICNENLDLQGAYFEREMGPKILDDPSDEVVADFVLKTRGRGSFWCGRVHDAKGGRGFGCGLCRRPSCARVHRRGQTASQSASTHCGFAGFVQADRWPLSLDTQLVMGQGSRSGRGPYPSTPTSPVPHKLGPGRATGPLHETVVASRVVAGGLRFGLSFSWGPNPKRIEALFYRPSVYKSLRNNNSVNYPRVAPSRNRVHIMRV